MKQSFAEFLKEEKFTIGNKYLQGKEPCSLELGSQSAITLKKLGEWALEQAKYWKTMAEKHKNDSSTHWNIYHWTMKEIAEACLGKEAVEGGLNE